MSARRLAFAAAVALALLAPPPTARAFERKPVAIAAFFRAPEVQRVSVSDDGAHFTTIVRLGDRREVRVYRRASFEHEVALSAPASVDVAVSWIARDRFVITSWRRKGTKWAHEVVVVGGKDESEKLIQSRYWVEIAGGIVDAAPGREGWVLFQNGRDVYQIDFREVAKPGAKEKWISDEHHAAKLPEGAFLSVVDREGRVRGALSFEPKGDEGGVFRIGYRDPEERRFRTAFEWDSEDTYFVSPLAIAADGEHLLVASNRERDRFALVELDPRTGEESEVIFAHETAEIVDVEFDTDGTSLVGVVFLENGEYRTHYFDGAYADERARIAALAPGKSVYVLATSAQRDAIAYLARSDTDPGGYFLFDATSGAVRELGRVSTLLDSIEFSERRRFTVRAKSGPEIEAIFTEPVARAGSADEWGGPALRVKPPLVVMPHGGPLGVRDDLGFDPLVQLLSYYGYAVLQVNYRGSGGFGKAFEDLGYGEVGRGIEDDVDAAYDYVIERGWVDASRVAAVGGSYGGYSSLMGTIRHPERYRCVVSLFGVTDLPLLFDDPFSRLYDRGRANRVALLGDPATDFEDLVARSPVYRASEITKPVYILHGSKDANVDIDHAYRLRVALERAGVPHRVRIVKDLDHSFGSPAMADELVDEVLRFLDEHMQPGSVD